MASPYKIPTAINERRGNPGKRAVNPNEPKLVVEAPKQPKELRDKVAREEWKYIIPILVDAGLMSRADSRALLQYCNSFSIYLEAEKKIVEGGGVLLDPHGRLAVNPWHKIRQQAWAECHKCLMAFGMTPSARTKVEKLPEPKDSIDLMLEDVA